MSKVLELNDVNSFYDKSHILFDLSFCVEEGESVCILGRNGVGKSTTMKTIIGIMNPKNNCSVEGSVDFQGNELSKLTSAQISKLGIAYVPQGRRIFTSLTTKENLQIAERKDVDGNQYWTIEKVYELFPRLKERENNLANKLSGGEQQMLAIGRALMQNPKLLLLDEITEGLAPIIVNQLAYIVASLKEHGVTILLAEQSVDFALSVSDRCYILEKGTVVFEGPTSAVTPEVAAKYLGT